MAGNLSNNASDGSSLPASENTSLNSSLDSDCVLLSDSRVPRKNSADSNQIKVDMAELLKEAGDAVGEFDDTRIAEIDMAEFDSHSDTESSQGRMTPTQGHSISSQEDVSGSLTDVDGRFHADDSSLNTSQFDSLRKMSKSDSRIDKLYRSHSEEHRPISGQLSVSSSISHTPLEKSPSKSDVEYTVFHGVTYLGSAKVNAPRSEVEIKRNMAILNDHTSMANPVCLHIPNTPDGNVRLTDSTDENEIATFKVHRIIFCCRGNVESAERNCFSFTCSHGDVSDSAMFQCHVFRCDLSDAVGKIMFSFQQSFSRLSKKPATQNAEGHYEDHLYTFDMVLEIKEDDGKGSTISCSLDDGAFKMRRDLIKTLTVTLIQTSNKELKIDRCFGMLLSPGRSVKDSDMHLIEMTSMGYDSASRSYFVSGEWNPTSDNFDVLNSETPKGMRVFMTVAVDLVFSFVREPVRFTLETKARIFPRAEKFWVFNKKTIKEKFYMHLKQAPPTASTSHLEQQYQVENLISETVKERNKALNLPFSSNTRYPADGGMRTPNDDDDPEGTAWKWVASDDESPIVSGSGHVSKDITDADLIDAWADTLKKWHSNLSQRPKQVTALCRRGIPEALRGEVWQLLAGCHQAEHLLEAYRLHISKESPCEDVILRDMHRTFPAHEFFKDVGGVGQDALYKLNKAYSVYDTEVGYCQGLSFLVAALLLHMPEEQAFSTLVKIMYDYQLRNFYKDGFHDLHLKFYQLERLLQSQVPDLYGHLLDLHLEAHMYASQWFLTLFTAKFPLYLVYRIIDIFLCDGINTIFNVAVALLKDSRRELLALDFEGVLKYFRVSLPKKYRTEVAAHELLEMALRIKINPKQLFKYEQEYQAIQAAQVKQEDPVERLNRENKRLMDTNMRLEQENDILAQDLITSKVSLRNDLDSAEDSVEALSKRLEITMREKADMEEINHRLSAENTLLKEKYRSDVIAAEQELTKNKEIIAQYKDVCSKMSERLEKTNMTNKEEMEKCKEIISKCNKCTEALKEANTASPTTIIDQSAANKDKKIRELELELAQTKLALVQIECKNQEMRHELNSKNQELQAVKNKWWNKSLASLREAVNKKTDVT